MFPGLTLSLPTIGRIERQTAKATPTIRVMVVAIVLPMVAFCRIGGNLVLSAVSVRCRGRSGQRGKRRVQRQSPPNVRSVGQLQGIC